MDPVAGESGKGGAETAKCGASTLPEDRLGGGSELGNIVINNVPTPPFPPPAHSKSPATPLNKRVLDQKEFDKKLKNKRALFSRGRSISLASFKLPTRLKLDRTEKPPKSPKRKLSEERLVNTEVRGELELLNIEQLINIQDLDNQRIHRMA